MTPLPIPAPPDDPDTPAEDDDWDEDGVDPLEDLDREQGLGRYGTAGEVIDRASDATDPGILDRPSTAGRARTPLERLRAALVTGDQIKDLPQTAPLITGVLDLDSTAVLYGRPGIGKSFIALDWGLSVATGSWWFGHEVVSGPVLYVAAEGSGGLSIRVGSVRFSV